MEKEGWLTLQLKEFKLALYQGHIKETMLNFRGGDVFAIAEYLKAEGLEMEMDAKVESDSSAGATMRDPDGNMIYFNTHPDEV